MAKRNQACRSIVAAPPAQPINVGMAPGTAPSKVHSGVFRLSGVYINRYDSKVEIASREDNILTVAARYTPPATLSRTPNRNASRALSRPEGRGRVAVLRILPSHTRSIHWF